MLQIIIFAVITLVIAYRLYTELGKNNGREENQSDWQPRTPLPEEAPVPQAKPRAQAPSEDYSDQIKSGIKQVQLVDSSFNMGEFTDGARAAFEMILHAFSAGDRDTLSSLLSKDVYGNFETAIKAREAEGQTLETSLVGFKSVDPVSVEVEDNRAFITLRFVSEQGFVLKKDDGSVIDTSGAQIDEVVDVWTFDRNLRSSDPTWTLIATASEDD